MESVIPAAAMASLGRVVLQLPSRIKCIDLSCQDQKGLGGRHRCEPSPSLESPMFFSWLLKSSCIVIRIINCNYTYSILPRYMILHAKIHAKKTPITHQSLPSCYWWRFFSFFRWTRVAKASSGDARGMWQVALWVEAYATYRPGKADGIFTIPTTN